MTVPNERIVSPSNQEQHGVSIYAALARTTTRALALYFSRPVRLFRPSKVSGWHSLRGHANSHGTALSPRYVALLIKSQGVVFSLMVIPKHFLPPMFANAVLGTVLWVTYTGCSNYLRSHFGQSMFTVALSGAAAGGMQALVAAPVENTRLVIEGGAGKGWSHAWKEVFQGTQPIQVQSRTDQIGDIRQVRLWMKDVGEMAGRGWVGWGWGFGKDICGFAAFFTIFDLTRKVAGNVTLATHNLQRWQTGSEASRSSHLARFVHAVTLVGGGMVAGLAYETLCRPWDVARRAITLERALPLSGSQRSSFTVLMNKLRGDGIISFFREHSGGHAELRSGSNRRISSALRTLGRVGPWGVGFLVWESFGPGLD